MNKSECEEIVRMVHALFNQALYKGDEKTVFSSWFALLEDLEFEETRAAVVACSSEEKYMPNAGAVRRQAKLSRLNVSPPTPHQFWGHIQSVIKARNTGTHENIRKDIAEHPVVMKTIEDIGADVVFGLHTNGDRAWVLEAYNENLRKHMANA